MKSVKRAKQNAEYCTYTIKHTYHSVIYIKNPVKENVYWKLVFLFVSLLTEFNLL